MNKILTLLIASMLLMGLPGRTAMVLQDVAAQFWPNAKVSIRAGHFYGGGVFGHLNDGQWSGCLGGHNSCLIRPVTYEPLTMANAPNRPSSFGTLSTSNCTWSDNAGLYEWKSRHRFVLYGGLDLQVFCIDQGGAETLFQSLQSRLTMSPRAGKYLGNYTTYTHSSRYVNFLWSAVNDIPASGVGWQWPVATDTNKVCRLDLNDMGSQDNRVSGPTIPGIDYRRYLHLVGSQGSSKGLYIFRALKSIPSLPENRSGYHAGMWVPSIQNTSAVGSVRITSFSCCFSYQWLPNFAVLAMRQHNAGERGFATAPAIFGPRPQQAALPGMKSGAQSPALVAAQNRILSGKVGVSLANGSYASTDNLRFADLAPLRAQITGPGEGITANEGHRGSLHNIFVQGVTATQAILRYTAPGNGVCSVEMTEASSGFVPLVHDVDPTLFAGANLDNRAEAVTSGTSRIFIAGKRVTEHGADGKFYSRALQTNTTHYYRIVCGSSVATGTFTTSNIPLGNTYTDVPQVDPATGQAVVPSFPVDRTTPVIDPQTGALVKRLWLPQDTSSIPYLNSGGQTRMCGYHLVGPGPGYLCYFPASVGVVYYIIPTTGEVRFLGELWISPGSDFPRGGATGVGAPSLQIDAGDSRVLYDAVDDFAGQRIIIKGSYSGDYSAVPGGSRASYTWQNLTPGPNYYPAKLIQALDPTFDPTKFSCSINAGGLNPNNGRSYSLIACNRYQQDSYGWVAAMDMGNGQPMGSCGSLAQCPQIVGVVNVVKNPQTRWCGLHNTKIIPDTPVVNLSFHGLTGNGTLGSGSYQVTLTQPIGPGDTTISVSGEPRSSDPIEPYLMDAAVGDVFILQGPTAEYISIVAKNSTTSWMVKRAFVAPGLWTAQAWPAGTKLAADCQPQVHQIPGNSGAWLEAYWRFLEDPHGSGPGYTLDQYFGGNHGDYQANLRVAGGFQGVQGPLLSTINTPLTFTISEDPTFAGARAFADGNSYSDYPSYQQSNAPAQEQNWFLSTREFLGGGNVYSADQGAQPISGQLYKYAFATWWGTAGLHRKQVATIAASGGYNLTDVSGPRSILSDTPEDSYKYCVAQVADECHAGSQPGDAFANAPNVKYLTCTGGDGFPIPGNLDLCLADMAPEGHSAYQYGLLANSEGVTDRSWGAGYSRRLGSGFSGIKGQQPLLKPLPDGTWAFFDVYGFMMSSDPATAPGLVMMKIPPFTKSDNVDRTTFLPTPLTIFPPKGQGIVSAGVEFGYAEQGLPKQYYCTSRREACMASVASFRDSSPFSYEQTDIYARMPCTTSCTISLPILPAHVAYYQVKYYDDKGGFVALGDNGIAAEGITTGQSARSSRLRSADQLRHRRESWQWNIRRPQ